MQCQILLVIHNWIQGNLERESGNLSEVTYSFSPGTPAIFAQWIRVTNQVSWFHPRTQAFIQFNHVNTHLENFLKLCIVFNYKDICLAIFSNILTCFWRICGINTHSKSPEVIRNELNVNNEQEYCNNNDNVLLSKCWPFFQATCVCYVTVKVSKTGWRHD